MTEEGSVKFYNAEKRFGFISAEAGDIFFSGAALDLAGIPSVGSGDRVSFRREQSPDGRTRAGQMRVLETAGNR